MLHYLSFEWMTGDCDDLEFENQSNLLHNSHIKQIIYWSYQWNYVHTSILFDTIWNFIILSDQWTIENESHHQFGIWPKIIKYLLSIAKTIYK